MEKEVSEFTRDLCEKCEYIESIYDEPVMSINGVDFYSVECNKDACNNGNGYTPAAQPKDLKKIIEPPEVSLESFFEE